MDTIISGVLGGKRKGRKGKKTTFFFEETMDKNFLNSVKTLT